MKLAKIGFIVSVTLLVIGLAIFLTGAGVKNFTIMWAGLIIFLIGVVLLVASFFYRLIIKERRKKVENMKRG